MIDELIDIFNEKNEPIGQKMKHEAHRDGTWHRVSHVWIYNLKGEILLQLRAKNKELYPDMWDISAAGHLGAGEDPITGGLREMEEEIGLTAKPEDLEFLKIRELKINIGQMVNNEFCYVYLMKYDGDIDNLDLRDGEVAKLKLLKLNELEIDLKARPERYAKHGDYWLEIIDAVIQKIG
ncbi:MAG: NUDIX domain-containing protein [Patescibacteria group bacterium]|jgi:isopentenyldiphosphate isomerase|nr:NUDIX domain-containing protein [Patescibacteria group bacterium]